ncbi:hypothetical protein [Bacillus sp. V3B]|nr:hypothetical protein [Bacillus sp. V3B]
MEWYIVEELYGNDEKAEAQLVYQTKTFIIRELKSYIDMGMCM